MIQRDPSLALSLAIHAAILGLFGVLALVPFTKPADLAPETVEFEVIDQPQVAAATAKPIELKNRPVPQKIAEPQEKIAGLSRKAIVSDAADGESSVTAKIGNTLAAEQDTRKLNDDAQDLPIPTDAYLVSSLPKLIEGVQVPYPDSARRLGIQGSVKTRLLIDAAGVVRQIEVLESPNDDMRDAAIEALKRFKFQPAKVDGKSVAVRITYTYTFKFER